ncbi:MAG: glycosyltransferase family 4 protein [Gemmatimonadota bacterium]|nr:glycosyltransferase family 4 protein [Gemmatimonadota bacterium]
MLLSLVFPPDAVSTAQLFGEVVEDLVERGWNVVVITTKPHYNPSDRNLAAQPLTPLWGGLLARSSFRGATVLHTAMPRKGSSVGLRIVSWLGFHVLSVAAALLKVGKVDVILSPSPPLSIGVAAWLIGLLKRAPFIYNVQELYPDTAVSLGVLSEGALLDLLRSMEKFVYDRAFAVTTIAPGMGRAIAGRTKDARKVRLIPNFVDTSSMAPRARDNPFSREFGLTGRFTVVYAGNMGPAQDLETVLDAAELTRDDERIVYVFVGDGTSRDSLERLTRSRRLSNVMFISQQPYDRVPDIYGASDLCVVPLAASLIAEAVPSKVYRIMAAERRVLAIADKNSDLAAVVMESKAGQVVEPGDAKALARTIISAADAPSSFAGASSRRYVMDRADRAAITEKYSALLHEAAISRKP